MLDGGSPWPARARSSAIRIPRRSYLFLAAGLLAASQSPNIIRIGEASSVAIATWRLLLAILLLSPFALKTGGLTSLTGREQRLLGFAGLTLAVHFVTWIAAVQHTTVANATLILALGPVLTAAGGYLFLRERVGGRLLAAMGFGLAGVAVLVGTDMRFSPENLRGDGLAVVSVVLFAGYTLLGRRLRPHLPNATYAASVYAVAGVVCLLVLVALGLPVVRYSNRDWLCFILMALIPTGIGHTALNHALRYLSAARLSVLILTEPALAGLVAYGVWGEPITAAMLVGFALIALAVVTLASESWTQKARAARLQQQ